MSTKKGFPSIEWSDSDDDFDFEAKEDHSEFESLLSGNEIEEVYYRPGDEVAGTLVGTPRRGESVAVDLGVNAAGIIDGMEFFSDDSQEPNHKAGDVVKMFVLGKSNDGYLLGLEKAKSLKSKEDLELAYRENIPVKGRVEKAVKGGFEVLILGRRAFCPVSRMDIKYVSEPASYVGHDYQFLITKLEGGGRNIVVDRAKILEQAKEKALAELESEGISDKKYHGKVTRMEPYGVFVTMENGLEGMVHISEISHIRLSHPSDTLRLGEDVFVVIKKIERDNRGQPKLSLSIRDAGSDPWEEIENELQVGGTYEGKVSRLQDFGAFVELKGMYEGLIHVSEMSWIKKIRHPRELLTVGDAVTVQIKGIDPIQKRISLTMKMSEDNPWQKSAPMLKVGQELAVNIIRLKDFGAIGEIESGLEGLVPSGKLKQAFGESFRKHSSPGQQLNVKIVSIDLENQKILFTLPGLTEEDESSKDYEDYIKAQQPKPKVDQPARGSFGDILAASMERKK